jgi:hypothetical protein
MKFLFLFMLISTGAMADVSREVFIRGKIGNEFDDKKVKVTDSLGQTYHLPTHVFGKGYKFKQGQDFFLEVHERDLKAVKITHKK